MCIRPYACQEPCVSHFLGTAEYSGLDVEGYDRWKKTARLGCSFSTEVRELEHTFGCSFRRPRWSEDSVRLIGKRSIIEKVHGDN